MATVTVPSIKTGDEITSTTINTFIDSVNALSSSVSSDNMDVEAVDRRNLRVNVPRVAHDQNNTTHTFSGRSNKLSTLTVDHVTGEMIHVAASFHFYERTPGTYSAAVSSQTYNNSAGSRSNFRFFIGRRKVGDPVFAMMPSTERQFSSAIRPSTGAYFPMSRSITIDFYETTALSDGQYEYALFAETFVGAGVGAFVPTAKCVGFCFFVVRYPR